MIIKGYKAFDSNLRCRDFQFEVGQTYSLNGELKICNHGFHFCLKLNGVFNYYPISYDTRVCEIEALSEVQSEENKSCTLNIKILRELSKEEIKVLTDDLKFNSGNRNSGQYNSGDYNSGYFNTNTPKVRLFNQNSDLDWNNPIISRLESLNLKPILQWVYESSMTEDEKKNYPSYKTTGGYLKNTGKQDWSSLSDEDKKFIQSLPGYNEEIFKEITGISLTK